VNEGTVMKSRVVRKIGAWVVGTAAIGGLAYSTFALSAKPTYASGPTCEPEDCAIVEEDIAPAICQAHEGVHLVICPYNSTYPDDYSISCNDGSGAGGNCANF
jgi:hypothetical protein